MAKYQPEKVKELITSPKNAAAIALAKKQEDRLNFHCEPVMEIQSFSPYYQEFLTWVSSFMKDAEKMNRFRALLTAPNPNVTSTKSIFDELGKVFETDDKIINFDFVSDEIEADANEYLTKTRDASFWSIEGFKALQVAICSLVVIDMPAVQTTERPEPYQYLVNISNVRDVSFKDNGDGDYLIFERKDKKLVYIDEMSYMVFAKQDNGQGNYEIEGLPAIHSTYDAFGNAVDGLGYAPFTSFYDAPIAGSRHINKAGPITGSLSNLDWLLFWKVSKKYLDLYGAYPIIVSYKQTCNYRDEHGNECHAGYVNYDEYAVNQFNGGEPIAAPKQKACPVCSKRGLIGAGSHWTVDPPQDKDDVDLMLNPIKIIEISNEKLEYGHEEKERLENEIYMDSVGWDGDALNKQAVNDNQVSANFESKQAVLDGIQKQFERVRKFCIDTKFKLRYGDYFLRSTVFLGRNYFLQNIDELTLSYTNALKAGLPMYMLASLREQISRNQNRYNAELAMRDMVLSNLEPYQEFTPSALLSQQVQYTDPIGYQIKINFNTFIQRFEREQMNIVEFGSLIPFKEKISKINSILESYAKEKSPIPPPQPAGTSGFAG